MILSYFWDQAKEYGVSWAQDIDQYVSLPWESSDIVTASNSPLKLVAVYRRHLVSIIAKGYFLFQDEIVFVGTTGQVVRVDLQTGIHFLQAHHAQPNLASVLEKLQQVEGMKERIAPFVSQESQKTPVFSIRVSPYTEVYYSIVTWQKLSFHL